jgi:hypothetical protein
MLLAVRESTPFEILVAEVSWMEYLRDRKSEVGKSLDKLNLIATQTGKHGLQVDELPKAEAVLRSHLSRIDEHFRVKASALGIQILPLPENISLRSLLEMSIDCVPPFEGRDAKSKEKGFRDSLIMFTVLRNLSSRRIDPAILVTGDGLLAEGVLLHQEQFGANIQVAANLWEAVELLERGMEDENLQRIKANGEEAKRTLETFREQILQKIAEIHELTDADLGQGGPFLEPDDKADYLSPMLGIKSPKEYVEIHRIKSVTYSEIGTAVWQLKNEQDATILFTIHCEAHVLARAPYLVTYTRTKKYVVGASPTMLDLAFTGAPTEEKTMKVHLFGKAKLERVTTGPWRLTSLTLDKSLPSEEDYKALWGAELYSTE